MTGLELQTKWNERRILFQQLGGEVDGVKIVDDFLADIADLARSNNEAILTLHQAAVHSGYSVEHLGRLVRAGRIPNVGHRGAPRIQLRDLPIKPKRTVAKAHAVQYDPRADARFIKADQR